MPEITREQARDVDRLLGILAQAQTPTHNDRVDADEIRAIFDRLAGPPDPGYAARVTLLMGGTTAGIEEVWAKRDDLYWVCLDDSNESPREWGQLLSYGEGRMTIDKKEG